MVSICFPGLCLKIFQNDWLRPNSQLYEECQKVTVSFSQKSFLEVEKMQIFGLILVILI